MFGNLKIVPYLCTQKTKPRKEAEIWNWFMKKKFFAGNGFK